MPIQTNNLITTSSNKTRQETAQFLIYEFNNKSNGLYKEDPLLPLDTFSRRMCVPLPSKNHRGGLKLFYRQCSQAFWGRKDQHLSKGGWGGRLGFPALGWGCSLPFPCLQELKRQASYSRVRSWLLGQHPGSCVDFHLGWVRSLTPKIHLPATYSSKAGM